MREVLSIVIVMKYRWVCGLNNIILEILGNIVYYLLFYGVLKKYSYYKERVNVEVLRFCILEGFNKYILI